MFHVWQIRSRTKRVGISDRDQQQSIFCWENGLMRKNVKKSLNEYDLDSQYLFYGKYFNKFIAVINFSSEFAPKIIRLFLLEYAFKLEIFFAICANRSQVTRCV